MVWSIIKIFLYYAGFPHIHELIQIEHSSRHHDDLLAGQFGINKTRKLVTGNISKKHQDMTSKLIQKNVMSARY